ncbi:SPOR domain-containing protein [Terrimonas pollutisoli]|uniref:SPOR domain-containing protein n=1 Tax=Terrimonas pollutisoli TaxID=3034147 RepID=UPI0023ECE70B|nr:SPOR domain-containing protein [Terrimonas sp. H1YJ31]
MKKLLFFCTLFLSLNLFAQNTQSTGDTNNVVIHKDPRIDLLISKQAQINEETTRESRRTVKGYRLMIISTSNRDEAIAAKTTVYTYFPELKAYLWHQSPYYKVKAGDFKERKEAEEYQKRLNVYFTKGVYIMNDIVELKPEKNREEQL